MKESSVLPPQRHSLRGQHNWRLIRIGVVTLLSCLMIGSALLLLQRFNHSQPPIYEGTPLNEPAAEFHLLDSTVIGPITSADYLTQQLDAIRPD